MADEILIISSKMKAAVKAAGCQSANDLTEALSEIVYQMLATATERAKANGRTTVRPCDLPGWRK